MKMRNAIPVAALVCASASAQTPTLWVIGDSTASNANRRGWADPFADYFDASKIKVVNSAKAGRSSRTFFTEGLWGQVGSQLKPGDFNWSEIFAGGVRWFHSGGIFAALSPTTAEVIIEGMKAAKAAGAGAGRSRCS